MLMCDFHLYKSNLMSTVTVDYYIGVTESALLIFLQSRVEKLLAWLDVEPTSLDLSFQSGSHDRLASAMNILIDFIK